MLKRAHTAARRTSGSSKRGTGSGEYQVKGRRATSLQRRIIDGCLQQAADDKASRRVMIAVVMCITQESGAGELMNVMTGNDDVGIYQQGRNWVSVSDSKKPAPATHSFLIAGPTSWRKVHGGVKKAPGNLSLAIHQVQANADPNAYAQWEPEATRTVDSWLDSGGSSEEGATEYIKRYSFTRGERGGSKENSWDAAQRLVEEVGAYRWAAANVLYAASGDELRAAAPVLTIHGDEPWLLKRPAWSWASGRAISEITFPVLAERWAILPGACVVLARRFGAMSGRWMLWNLSGESLDNPEATVVLRRPTALKIEPAAEVGTHEAGLGAGAGNDLARICKEISDHRSAYVYGGGHGPPLRDLKSSSHMDCSSSVSLALYRAHMMEGRTRAIVSGEFASSWGKAGKGDEFTVWAHSGHVWIEGYNDAGAFAWRFDTSHHSGKSGPMYTTVKRTDQARFTARHLPGH
jgi:hypothetical protein